MKAETMIEYDGLIRGNLSVLGEPYNWRGQVWVQVRHIDRPKESNTIHLSWWLEGELK